MILTALCSVHIDVTEHCITDGYWRMSLSVNSEMCYLKIIEVNGAQVTYFQYIRTLAIWSIIQHSFQKSIRTNASIFPTFWKNLWELMLPYIQHSFLLSNISNGSLYNVINVCFYQCNGWFNNHIIYMIYNVILLSV